MEIDRIYNEDCLVGMKQIPDGSVDLVVTDPPYLFVQGGMKSKNLNVGTKSNDSYINTDMSNFGGEEIRQLCETLRPLFRNGYNAYFFCSEMQICHYLSFAIHNMLRYNLLVWDRGISNMISYKFFRSHIDYIVRIYNGSGLNKVVSDRPNEMYSKIRYGQRTKMFHPSEKPIRIIQDFLLLSSNTDAIILDPFMGSGTTAVACIREKRHFIGFELSKEYFDKAQKRIQAEQSQLKLF
jgi:DNA modification methylase